MANSAELQALAQENMEKLAQNSYPGRGIVLGLTPDQENLVQIYWIMGRSENSRNRVFIDNGDGSMRTKAWDESKLEDPSLIIYHPARVWEKSHIITNGDQTDTIFEALPQHGGSFESALKTREYEPDGPNFTPRISGIMELGSEQAYSLSILKSFHNTESSSLRQFFHYEKALAGLGHCITTYQGDGDPLPSFAGEPYLMPLSNDIEANAQNYWNALDADNRVSMLVKYISVATGETELKIVNRHQ